MLIDSLINTMDEIFLITIVCGNKVLFYMENPEITGINRDEENIEILLNEGEVLNITINDSVVINESSIIVTNEHNVEIRFHFGEE